MGPISAVEAGFFNTKQRCEALFSKDERFEKTEKDKLEIFGRKKLNSDQAISLFQKLPTKFRREITHDLAVYLAKYSPDPSAVDRAAALYRSEPSVAPKTLNLAIEYIKKGEYLSKVKKDYLEFSLRMHPELNEIMRLFDIPGFATGQQVFHQERDAVVIQLMHLDPTQAQIVIRSTIHEIIEKKDKNINPYAFSILMNVAAELGSDKASRYLAYGLKKVFINKSLLPNLTVGEKQIRLIVRRLIDNSSYIALVRLKEAVKKTLSFDPNSGWGILNIVSSIIATITNAGNLITRDSFIVDRQDHWRDHTPWDDRIESSSLNDYTGYTLFDHWNWQINTLGFYLASYTIKTIYHLIYDLRDPHPGNYLREETDLEIKTLNDKFQQQSLALYGILGGPQNIPSTLIPAQKKSVEVETPLVVPETPLITLTERGDPEVNRKVVPARKYSKSVSKKEVRENFRSKAKSAWLPLTKEQTSANTAFFRYFDEVRLQLLERDALLDHLQLGLLLNEPANIQIIGEPGVAKTQVAVKVLGQITEENGSPALFRFQMGKNTTIGELIGVVKQSGLKEDRIVRAVERALAGFSFGFLDEYWEAHIDTRKDLLTLQAEGVISIGGETYRSKGMLTLYASNKYPNQVFFEAGNDGPRAEMDRMLSTHIMSPTFEYDENMIDLEYVAGLQMKSQLNVQQIKQLKTLIDHISVPRYYLAKTKMVVNHLRRVEIKREHDSKIEWLRRERTGEINLTPPDYMTRVLSPRSEKRAYQLLKAFALMDWLSAKAKGLDVPDEPQINETHFLKLVEFFVFNGPSDEHIDRILREYPEGSVPNQQFAQLKKGRSEFFDLVAITDRNVNQKQSMQELYSFLKDLNINPSNFENMTLVRLNEGQKLNDNNASIVMALLEWHSQLGQTISDAPKIKEISEQDVAAFKAYYLGALIIEEILGI
jgi:MoxR-like ATPase